MKRIATFDAKPEMVVASDVYSRTGALLVKKGTILSPKCLDKLIKYGVPTIYISDDKIKGNSKTTDIGKKQHEPIEMPDVIDWDIRIEAERIVQQLFRDVKLGNLLEIERAKTIVDNIIKQVMKNINVVGKLADIRILDDYTFAHSVNVCVLSVAIGIVLGYSKLKLRELGIGALLHDVGKVRIPEEILKKPSCLTEEEFDIIKNHCVQGYKILANHPDISSIAASISLQHHERYNGDGYPYGIVNTEIHEYSKIVSIADVYDALTADRIYKNAIYPYEAVEVIIASGGKHFDPELVKIFVQNVSIYPVGSTVLLNTGETGIVTDVNRSLPIRPTIKLLKDKNGFEVKEDIQIDMMNNPTLFINEVVSIKKPVRNC